MTLTPLKREDLPQYKALFKAAEDTLGFVPNSALTVARDPELMAGLGLLSLRAMNMKQQGSVRDLWRLGVSVVRSLRSPKEGKRIDAGLRQLIALAVSYSAGCRYCQAHTAMTAAHENVPEEKISQLLEYESSALYSDGERAALDLAFAAGQVPNAVTPEHFRAARRHFNDDQVLDIVLVIAYFGFLNQWNATMGTALEAEPIAAAERLLGDRWQIGKHG
ncbi:MAG: carboxymuconolactone decarboxylase family protein [Myxococcota bacterium]